MNEDTQSGDAQPGDGKAPEAAPVRLTLDQILKYKTVAEVEAKLKGLKSELEDSQSEKRKLEDALCRVQVELTNTQNQARICLTAAEDAEKRKKAVEGALAELDNRRKELDREVEDLIFKQDDLSHRISALTDKHSELTATVNALEERDETLRAEVNELEGREQKVRHALDDLTPAVGSLRHEKEDLDRDLPPLRDEHAHLLEYKKTHLSKLAAVREREKRCSVIEAREQALANGEQELERSLEEQQEAEKRLQDGQRKLRVGRRELGKDSRELEEDMARHERTPHARMARRMRQLEIAKTEAQDIARRLGLRLEKTENRLQIARDQGQRRKTDIIGVPSEILEWLESGEGSAFELPKQVAMIGEGPILTDEFITFLDLLGISAYDPGDCESTVLVTGRKKWSQPELESQMKVAEDGILKIYSQEMFVAAIVTGRDPFLADDEDLLLAFARGHAALEDLQVGPFAWPATECEDLDDPPPPEFDQVGETPLHRMGYHAGRVAGLAAATRRNILREAYGTDELPPVIPGEKRMTKAQIAAYMETWGRPESRKRLWRLAHHLAMLIRTRRRLPGLEHAVEDWASDLEWIKKNLYGPGMRFKWPET